MRQIPLTRGYVAVVDDGDFTWASGFSWFANTGKGRKVYAARKDGLGVVLMHVELARPGPGVMVDHRDGNGLHNWRENLRAATPSQNAMNRPPRLGQRFKGVYWNTRLQRFEAHITAGGRRHWLGLFGCAQAAANSYDAAAVKLCGEFAWLNRDHASKPLPKGVSYDKRRQTWQVELSRRGKLYMMQSFETKREAMTRVTEWERGEVYRNGI